MKVYFLFLIIAISTSLQNVNNKEQNSNSEEEIALYNLIMEYRKSKNLPIIPWSPSLNIVAKTHAKDLNENHPDKKNCNSHSWSNKGTWTKCCYTPDHKKASCMWDKPRELTTYKDDGFEIACSINDPDNTVNAMKATLAIDMWKKSKHHNDIIINKDIWKKVTWKAIGISIQKDYAIVWFGKSTDNESESK